MMWLDLLMILTGAAGLAAGITKATRTKNRAWHILTAVSAALTAAGIALAVSTLLLLGGIASQGAEVDAEPKTDPAADSASPQSGQTKPESFPYEPYGKDRLTDAQISLYEEMYPKIAALEPFSYDAETYGYNVLDDVFLAWGGISIDHPEIDNYFLIKDSIDDEGETISLDAQYLCKWDDSRSEELSLVRAGVEEFETAADEILAGLHADMTAYEKYLYLAKAVSERADYDYAYESAACPAPWGGVVGGLSICQGFSEAYQYLCRRANLWCRMVEGEFDGVSHAWNLIWLPEGTYHVDITWADEQGAPGSAEWLRYFCLTQGEIEQDHIITDGSAATGQ